MAPVEAKFSRRGMRRLEFTGVCGECRESDREYDALRERAQRECPGHLQGAEREAWIDGQTERHSDQALARSLRGTGATFETHNLRTGTGVDCWGEPLE